MKFKDIVPEWANYKRGMVKESTFAAYSMALRKHVLPTFGEWELKDMTKKRIKLVLLGWLQEKGLSKKTIADYLIVIKMLLDFASSEMELEEVPNARWKMEWPTVAGTGETKLERYDKSQLAKLIDHCEQHPSTRNLGILLVCCTGIRIGEVCGLRWEDVDIQNKCFTVNRTLERIYIEDPSAPNGLKTKLIFSEPKTLRSRRTIPISPKIFEMVKCFSKVSKPDYYIVSGAPKPIEPRTFRIYYRSVTAELGLPGIKFHGLRHTFASTLVESGVDVKTVASILGHSDVSTTLNLYCHPTDEGKADAIKAGLSSVFKGRKGKK